MPWVTVMPDSSWKSFFLLLKLNIPFQKSQSIVPSVASVRGALVPLRLLGNILKHSERCSVISEVLSISEVGMLVPYLIRKTEKKPLENISSGRSTDLDNVHGHWPLANKEMAAALEFKGYEYQFVMTQGGHSGQPGGRMLADSLRWLWKDTQL